MIKSNKFAAAEKQVKKLLGKKNILTNKTALLLNSFDGSPVKSLPDAVLEIKDIEKLPKLIEIFNKFKTPFVPRAAGSNHDGGTIALKGGCVLNLNHLDKIEEINTQELWAKVQCGTVNGILQKALAEQGFFYAPDPASKDFSTIGGNCALGAGGPKTLKYGASTANVLKAEFVLPSGELLLIDRNAPGPDLAGLLLRSEGTLGLISRIWVKIYPISTYKKTVLAYFPSLADAMLCVKQIIACGIIPSALEALDKSTLKAIGTDTQAEALLIAEIEDKKTEAAAQAKKVLELCLANKVFNAQTADKEEQRAQLWQKRFSAAAALASLGSGLYSLDCAVSRASLTEIIKEISAIYEKYNLKAGIIFHAGDGNLHPNIAFNADNSFELSQIKKAIKEIHTAVCHLGGTISAEHGIGVEKRAAMAMMFDKETLELFQKIKKAADPFNISNPDKVLPIASQSKKTNQIPADLLPLIEQVKQANSLKKPLKICGLNSKIKLKDKNKLSLKNLNKIIEIDKENYTITVQAGIDVKNLQEELLKQNLYLPIQGLKGSLGGEFCAKSFAELKDYITGLDFITPYGDFIHWGGKYLKNTAGYDLAALLSGSRGIFGIVTALTLRVLPFKNKNSKRKTFAEWKPNNFEKALKTALDPQSILNTFYFEDKHNED